MRTGACRKACRAATVCFLVGAYEPSPNTWAIAIEVGAQHLYSLPTQEGLLVHRLSEVAQDGGVGLRGAAGR